MFKGRTVRGTLCERANPSFHIWRSHHMWHQRHMNPLTPHVAPTPYEPFNASVFFDAFGVVGVGLGGFGAAANQPTTTISHTNYISTMVIVF